VLDLAGRGQGEQGQQAEDGGGDGPVPQFRSGRLGRRRARLRADRRVLRLLPSWRRVLVLLTGLRRRILLARV
jgi:hypothetical protein